MGPSFFKPLVGDFPKKLLIPPAFVEKMEGKLGSNWVLKYECERLYVVQVEKLEEGRFFFVDGWPQFVTDHGLEYGDFVVFYLIQDSTFQVKVYDPSMCEKDCCDSHRNKSVDRTAVKAIKEEAKTSLDQNTSSRVDLTENNEETDTNTETDDEPEEATSNDDAPSFRLLLTEASKIYIPLPLPFVRESGLADKTEMKLRDPKGKKWAVKMVNEGNKAALTLGWSDLFVAHRMKKGDTCIFTYVRRQGATGIIQVDLRRGRGRPPKKEPGV